MQANIHPELLNAIRQLQGAGYRVYVSAPSTSFPVASYCYFTKDDKIGYMQYNNFDGLTFTTVHKPCRQCGTGFRITDREYNLPLLQAAEFTINCIAPNWATNPDRNAVVKWANWEAFANSRHNSWAKLQEVPHG